MDKRYIAYLRGRIGTSIWLPEQADLDKAAEQYPDGPKGITQVMQINGALAKMIFDRNKAGHEFWVEVSYVIPWMFPFLQPDGLVMKLNSEPTELTSEMVDADRRFWDAYVEKLITHPDYARDASAQATFSKLRCSIAVLLVARGQTSAAEYAYNQAVRLSPASPEAALGLAELYAKEGRWVEAIARAEEFKKLNPEKASFADVSVASFKKRQAAAEQNGIRSVAP
jgi:tetratricopeptide (TPR) repeat protein